MKRFAFLIILLAIALSAAALVSGWHRRTSKDRDSSPPSQVQTGGWATHESKRFGFAVRHPRELIPYEIFQHPYGFASGVYFANKKVENDEDPVMHSDFDITTDNDSPHNTLDEVVQAYQEAPAGIEYVVKDITVDGYPAKALYYNTDVQPLAHVVLFVGKKLVVFSLGNSLVPKDRSVFENMVATFDFKE